MAMAAMMVVVLLGIVAVTVGMVVEEIIVVDVMIRDVPVDLVVVVVFDVFVMDVSVWVVCVMTVYVVIDVSVELVVLMVFVVVVVLDACATQMAQILLAPACPPHFHPSSPSGPLNENMYGGSVASQPPEITYSPSSHTNSTQSPPTATLMLA